MVCGLTGPRLRVWSGSVGTPRPRQEARQASLPTSPDQPYLYEKADRARIPSLCRRDVWARPRPRRAANRRADRDVSRWPDYVRTNLCEELTPQGMKQAHRLRVQLSGCTDTPVLDRRRSIWWVSTPRSARIVQGSLRRAGEVPGSAVLMVDPTCFSIAEETCGTRSGSSTHGRMASRQGTLAELRGTGFKLGRGRSRDLFSDPHRRAGRSADPMAGPPYGRKATGVPLPQGDPV